VTTRSSAAASPRPPAVVVFEVNEKLSDLAAMRTMGSPFPPGCGSPFACLVTRPYTEFMITEAAVHRGDQAHAQPSWAQLSRLVY
jgi:hypothetical protein